MGRWIAMCALLAIGCKFDASVTSAGGDAGASVDSAQSADAAAPLGAFGEPELVTALSSTIGQDDPSLTADRLEIYFERGSNIFRALRETTAEEFRTPILVSELSSGSETTPEVAPDGLTIWFASTRAGGLGQSDIWMAERASRTDPWGDPVPVVELNTDGDDIGPATDESGIRMVLHWEAPTGGGDWQLYTTTRTDPSNAWATPVELVELNSSAGDGNGVFAAGGLELWFASSRPGGAGSWDIYVARRASLADSFGPPEQVAELATAGDDNDPWLSADGRIIYFARNETGVFQIYRAERGN